MIAKMTAPIETIQAMYFKGARVKSRDVAGKNVPANCNPPMAMMTMELLKASASAD
jgi:hypothetical protein